MDSVFQSPHWLEFVDGYIVNLLKSRFMRRFTRDNMMIDYVKINRGEDKDGVIRRFYRVLIESLRAAGVCEDELDIIEMICNLPESGRECDITDEDLDLLELINTHSVQHNFE